MTSDGLGRWAVPSAKDIPEVLNMLVASIQKHAEYFDKTSETIFDSMVKFRDEMQSVRKNAELNGGMNNGGMNGFKSPGQDAQQDRRFQMLEQQVQDLKNSMMNGSNSMMNGSKMYGQDPQQERRFAMLENKMQDLQSSMMNGSKMYGQDPQHERRFNMLENKMQDLQNSVMNGSKSFGQDSQQERRVTNLENEMRDLRSSFMNGSKNHGQDMQQDRRFAMLENKMQDMQNSMMNGGNSSMMNGGNSSMMNGNPQQDRRITMLENKMQDLQRMCDAMNQQVYAITNVSIDGPGGRTFEGQAMLANAPYNGQSMSRAITPPPSARGQFGGRPQSALYKDSNGRQPDYDRYDQALQYTNVANQTMQNMGPAARAIMDANDNARAIMANAGEGQYDRERYQQNNQVALPDPYQNGSPSMHTQSAGNMDRDRYQLTLPDPYNPNKGNMSRKVQADMERGAQWYQNHMSSGMQYDDQRPQGSFTGQPMQPSPPMKPAGMSYNGRSNYQHPVSSSMRTNRSYQ